MTHTVESLGFERETLFPNWWRAINRGEPLCTSGSVIEAAQDRVAMRRYIRQRVPVLREAVRDMDAAELSTLCDELRMFDRVPEPDGRTVAARVLLRTKD